MDLTAGTGGKRGWVAAEANYGNGLLKRLEHRQQYKANGLRTVEWGNHRVTLAGIAYYGTSYVPGLVPLGSVAGTVYSNADDTVDPRQRDQTHTAIAAVNDDWRPSRSEQVQFSGFFRTYNLSLFSDFGQGLIRQSEFRTAAGANAEYARQLPGQWWLLAGVDAQREAPRRDDLDRYGFYTPGTMSDGPFTKVDGANVTITPVAPFCRFGRQAGSACARLAGWRRDEIDFDNRGPGESRKFVSSVDWSEFAQGNGFVQSGRMEACADDLGQCGPIVLYRGPAYRGWSRGGNAGEPCACVPA